MEENQMKVFTDESLATFVEEIKTYTDNAVSAKADSDHSHDDKYYTETEIDEKLIVATEDDINTMLAELDLSSAPTTYRIFDTIHMSNSTTGEVYEVTVSDGHLAIAEQTA